MSEDTQTEAWIKDSHEHTHIQTRGNDVAQVKVNRRRQSFIILKGAVIQTGKSTKQKHNKNKKKQSANNKL